MIAKDLPREFNVVLYGHEQNVLIAYTRFWAKSEREVKRIASMLVKFSLFDPDHVCINTEYGEHYERFYGFGGPSKWTNGGFGYRSYKKEC